MRNPFTALILATALSCAGDKDTDTDSGADGDADTDADSDTDTDVEPEPFDISGNAIDLPLQGPAADGLCVDLVDPTPLVTGGGTVPIVLETVTISGGAGAFTFTQGTTEALVGLLMTVQDCAGGASTVYDTATGIPATDLTGDPLTGQTAFSINNGFLDALDLSAQAALYAGDLPADGFMFGFLLDSAGIPLDGGTVTCGACGTTFYLDADPLDGLFTTGLTVNTATSALGGGIWVIPAGPIETYTATAPGATFTDQLNGSNAGSATVTAFYAQ